ncbi:8-oxo-dGTP diphosphatase [Salininema proteolyticum]|uniref:Oxidized purine nucleoside triphosphate hydrolase n=1 Tax=Salininema proteolyticum TaxID=1607685 RepID=A0ABV8TYS3_9ACTN
MPTRSTCLVLLVEGAGDERRLLLGRKQRGFGSGKVVAIGGHLEDGESAVGAAVRETREETGLVVKEAALRQVASIEFRFPARPEWDLDSTVFASGEFEGTLRPCEEIVPEWVPVGALPLESMWADSRHWLPPVLAGARVRARFVYGDDCETLADILIEPLFPDSL